MSEFVCEVLRAEDGAVVLIMRITATERAFYKPAIEAFTKSVRSRLYNAALQEYAMSEDRRKRYRFPPHTAEFCLMECGDHTELRILRNGEVLRCERHYWDGEILNKRERIR